LLKAERIDKKTGEKLESAPTVVAKNVSWKEYKLLPKTD
jgi:hypothetical protein